MKRLAETMWHTFNSHNFAELFRTFLPERGSGSVEEHLPWDDWKSHYYSDMLELIIRQIKENDEKALDCIRQLINSFNQRRLSLCPSAAYPPIR